MKQQQKHIQKMDVGEGKKEHSYSYKDGAAGETCFDVHRTPPHPSLSSLPFSIESVDRTHTWPTPASLSLPLSLSPSFVCINAVWFLIFFSFLCLRVCICV